ncbi:hypothetical protein Pr1d_23490 [Bythopirellula goksoeyrii]|uniref:Uncharacterized protein n=1 Tax=Bythopirellula goksoeyrii TaxID=1400387 RepID=A0A5B9Q7U0_9BACT|nr:hypothetical protein Pr1d_23490 [Bythopirellula goksoeyrii]
MTCTLDVPFAEIGVTFPCSGDIIRKNDQFTASKAKVAERRVDSRFPFAEVLDD